MQTLSRWRLTEYPGEPNVENKPFRKLTPSMNTTGCRVRQFGFSLGKPSYRQVTDVGIARILPKAREFGRSAQAAGHWKQLTNLRSIALRRDNTVIVEGSVGEFLEAIPATHGDI